MQRCCGALVIKARKINVKILEISLFLGQKYNFFWQNRKWGQGNVILHREESPKGLNSARTR
jgi:hypothetical protein